MPDDKENIRSKKRKRTGSKKKELQSCEFHDYACAKSFDILSKGKKKTMPLAMSFHVMSHTHIDRFCKNNKK